MKAPLLVGALAASLASATRAAPDELPIVRVEIVGALPLAHAQADADRLPYLVQAADRQALEQAGGLVEFMARRLNGVNVNEIAGNPLQADLSYRGYRASPTLGTAQGISVYLDGVRVNEAFGDVVNWDMLPQAAIGKLVLVSGSNPLYGLNTLGGALALETRSGLDAHGSEAEVSAGMPGRQRVEFSSAARSADGWHRFVATSLLDERGWRAHSSGRLGNLFFKAGHAAGATDWTLALLGGRATLEGNGLLPDELYAQDRGAAYTYPDRTRNRVLQAVFHLTHRLDHAMTVTGLAYTRHSQRSAVSGDVSDAYADYVDGCDALSCAPPAGVPSAASLNSSSTSQHADGASANLHGVRGRHAFDAGATFDRNRVRFDQFEQAASFSLAREVLADPGGAPQATSSVAGTARMAALYAADTWALTHADHLSVSARWNGARVANTLRANGGRRAPQAFSYRKLNPALGITHQAGPLTVFANAAASNRIPTAIELGCADPSEPCRLPVGLQSDPYLKQVVARTFEGGVRGHWASSDASVNLYRTVNHDDILFVSAGASHAGYFANVARTRHEGIEASAATWWGHARWRIDYSYLRAIYDAPDELDTGARMVHVRPGTPIAGLPRHTLKLAVQWQAGPGLAVGADVQAVSALVTQGNEDGGARQPGVGGHALLNLHASWRVRAGWELFARVTNALDRRYETWAALATDMFPNGQLRRASDAQAAPARFVAPGAPRLVSAGLRYRF
jgi:outer membrane receptor protein involved in Fe transport